MRIGLNLLHAMPDIGGVWNYLERLLCAIGQHDHENAYICFVTKSSQDLVSHTSNFDIVTIALDPRSRAKRVLYENTCFPARAKRHQLDMIHWFSGTHSLLGRIPSVVSVYDTLVFEHPESFSIMKRNYLKYMMKNTVRNAALLMPMSNTTAKNLEWFLGAKTDRIQVIPPIIDSSFIPRDQKEINLFRKKYNLPENFWLYVADFYPHKNHLGLLHAFHNLIKNRFSVWPLVLRGDNRGDDQAIFRAVNDLELSDNISFMPRLPSEELSLLFSSASAMIYPSLYEGGGIPVLEAMACGCPVAASHIPATEEMAGGAAMLFKSQTKDAIEQTVIMMQTDKDLRDRLATEGMERARKFRGERVIGKVLDGYRKAVASVVR
jgi:glycosyltransferase involved in cell wall biosynthesis